MWIAVAAITVSIAVLALLLLDPHQTVEYPPATEISMGSVISRSASEMGDP